MLQEQKTPSLIRRGYKKTLTNEKSIIDRNSYESVLCTEQFTLGIFLRKNIFFESKIILRITSSKNILNFLFKSAYDFCTQEPIELSARISLFKRMSKIAY